MALLVVWLAGCSNSHEADKVNEQLQQHYQPIATELALQSVETAPGERLYYVDDGEAASIPVLLVSGFGTSVTATMLTNHLKQLRQQLGIRLVSVQRNGFGDRPYRQGWNYGDYVDEVNRVLALLGIEEFHLFAISGGGPYAAAIAATMPHRLHSMHLAATITGNTTVSGVSTLPSSLQTLCTIAANSDNPAATMASVLSSFALDSAASWWDFDPANPMLAVEGFEDAAAADWSYTFNTLDSQQSLQALAAEALRYCNQPLPTLAGITAPVYIYQGTEDASSPGGNVTAWRQALANSSQFIVRTYPGEGHWVQYSHLEQVLTDIARPGQRVVCDGEGSSQWLEEGQAQALLDSGSVSDGLCPATH